MVRSRMLRSFRLARSLFGEMLAKFGSGRDAAVSCQHFSVSIKDDRRRQNVRSVARIQESLRQTRGLTCPVRRLPGKRCRAVRRSRATLRLGSSGSPAKPTNATPDAAKSALRFSNERLMLRARDAHQLAIVVRTTIFELPTECSVSDGSNVGVSCVAVSVGRASPVGVPAKSCVFSRRSVAFHLPIVSNGDAGGIAGRLSRRRFVAGGRPFEQDDQLTGGQIRELLLHARRPT